MAGYRIDFLATAPPEDTTSGLSRVVWELAAALVPRGHHVRVMYPYAGPVDPPGPYRGVTRVPVPLVGMRRRPFGRDIAIGENASDLIDRAADVVVGNDEKAGALALRSNGPAFVYFVHDVSLHTFDTLRPLEPKRGLRQTVGNFLDRRTLKRLEGTALRRARAVVVATELNRKLLAQYYTVPAEKIRAVPYGVPDPLDVGSREAARLALHVPSDVPAVAFVGRTPDRQGLPTALAAFRRVRVFFPGARFLVVGSDAPTEPGVVPLGVADETTKANVLRAADVFLFPARYEGFGLAPREAMRYGVATIVSEHVPMDGATPKEAVRIVSGDDPGEYASDLAELLADPATRRSVGEAGRKYADQFSYAKMAEKVESIFAEAIDGATRRR